jgi:hypothetical protein
VTKEQYESIVGAKNLARWEEMAASKKMTGLQLAERMAAKAVENFDALDGEPDPSLLDPVSGVTGNVIQVNFGARAAASWNSRKTHQAPAKRRQTANRVSLMPIRVPSTSPTVNSTAVPSTSPDTVVPYSSR